MHALTLLATCTTIRWIDNWYNPGFVDAALRDMVLDVTRKQAPVMTRCVQRVQDLPEMRKYLEARDGKFTPLI